MIHPTAIIHPGAQLHESVRVGPYSVIDEHVTLGAGCELGPHVHLTGHTAIGAENRFHTGCVIGDAPQDMKYDSKPTQLIIGERNLFREHVTVHRSNTVGEYTRIGSENFLMANSHVGHNAIIGNKAILANGVLIAGHAMIGDGAFLAGNAVVHQFCRVGAMAMMQGCAGVSLDLPPFTIVRGINGMCGLNSVGLKRAGFSVEERRQLKKAYHAIFLSGDLMRDALEKARADCSGVLAEQLIDFVAVSQRGTCAHARR
ncbi:MAG: acyl-ACP--UDP-N-acetylglucosamine O-acyltransferase [Verrucomicrobiota bacterium]|jgi:UDP-N-acetylglucosamine acyltransferase|nr:acyl-ACP--UDP-N-acetylglucosamine O-acyltransferase [Verrucomicrobiota bacterium]